MSEEEEVVFSPVSKHSLPVRETWTLQPYPPANSAATPSNPETHCAHPRCRRVRVHVLRYVLRAYGLAPLRRRRSFVCKKVTGN